MGKLARITGAGVTVGVISIVGLASGASAYSIYNTGPFSNNGIYSNGWNGYGNGYNGYYNSYYKLNKNNISVNNSNSQTATSGNAYSSWNTFGGGAYSGAASNWNNTSTNVSVWNY